MYIKDLPVGLCKLFAHDTSLFWVVHDVQFSKNDVNSDLQKTYEWAYQWKMDFNPDTSKRAQEIIFGRKVPNTFYPDVPFNNNSVNSTTVHKFFGIIQNSQLSFEGHLKICISESI